MSLLSSGHVLSKPHLPTAALTLDDWEVAPSDIVVDDSLGEGAFGEVYKGFLKGPITCSKVKPQYRNAVHVGVAIKLLKGTEGWGGGREGGGREQESEGRRKM